MRLIERDREREKLRESLTETLNGQGCALIVSGPVGSGKTTTLQDLAAQAERNGCRVVRATASLTERPLPLGVVDQLFAGLGNAAADARRAVDQLIGNQGMAKERTGFDLHDPPRAHALRALWTPLLLLSVREPLVISIDDVQHIDGDSLHFLLYLGRRLRSVRMMLALGDGETALGVSSVLQSELAPLPGSVRLALEPLSPEGVASVLADRGAAHGQPFAARCHRLTGGNPALTVALADDCAATGTESPIAPGGEAFSLAVLATIRRRGDLVLQVARQLAVLGEGASTDLVAACAEADLTETERALETLTAASLLSQGTFRHPAARATILSELDFDTRAELNRRAALALLGAGCPAVKIAGHLLACGRGEPWMVPILEEAVEQALEDDRGEDAAEFLRLASASCPDGPRRMAIMAKVVQLEWQSDPRSAERHLPSLYAADSDGVFRPGSVTRMLGSVLWSGHFEIAARLLRAQADGEYDAEDIAGLRISYYRALHTYPVLRDVVAEPPAMSARHISPQEHAAEILGATISNGGNASLAERAEQILATVRVGDHTMDIIQSLLQTLVYCGWNERARVWCDHARDSGRLSRPWRAMVEAIRGEVALREGAPEQARHHVQLALDLISPQQWGVALAAPLGCLVLACTAMGQHEEAQGALHQPLLQASFQTRYGLSYLHARGHHNLAVGALGAALTDYRTCGRLMTEWGMDHAEVVPWRIDAALVHLRLGEAGEARALVEAHLERDPGDLAARQLRDCAVRRPADGVQVPAALHRACGGVPNKPLRSDAPPASILRLTNAEQRVAQLVVRGQSNRQIATSLSVTPSTVEQHLTNILRKLGIRSRTQVDARLRQLSILGAD